MSAQDNAVLARRVYQLFSENRFDQVLDLVHEDVEAVIVPFGMTFNGRQGFIDFMQGWKNAFPDLVINVCNQFGSDDQIVNEITATGTHNGPLQTPDGIIPATGRSVDFTVCEVWKVKNGRMIALRNYQDAASLMRQLGLIG